MRNIACAEKIYSLIASTARQFLKIHVFTCGTAVSGMNVEVSYVHFPLSNPVFSTQPIPSLHPCREKIHLLLSSRTLGDMVRVRGKLLNSG